MKTIRIAKSSPLWMWGAIALLACSTQGAKPDPREIGAQSLVTVVFKPRLEKWDELFSPSLGWAARSYDTTYPGRPISREVFFGYQVPVRMAGFLFAPDRVIVGDPLLRVREMNSIEVERNGERIAATMEQVCVEQDAVLLKLERPFSAKAFTAPPTGASTGYMAAVSSQDETGAFYTTVTKQEEVIRITTDGQQKICWKSLSQILDESGKVFGYATAAPFAKADFSSETTDPVNWRSLSPQQLTTEESKVSAVVKNSFRPVTFCFRPVKKEPGSGRQRYYYRPSEDPANRLEVTQTGIFLNPQRLLVPCELTYDQVARLESIQVTLADGKTVAGRFVCALRTVQAIIVEVPHPDPRVVLPLASEPPPVRQLQYSVSIDGITKEGYETQIHRARVTGIGQGWRGQPTIRYSGRGDFLFSPDGRCTSLMLGLKRLGPDEMSPSYYRTTYRDTERFFAGAVAEWVNPVQADVQAAWVPLDEVKESRLGWLGIDLQELDRALAEARGVSGVTRAGAIGGLVMRVQPNSPAARAGIETDWILTRILPAERMIPVDIFVKDSDSYYERSFSWDDLDRFSSDSLENMSTPWPMLKTNFRRYLTENVGIGSKLTAEFWTGGKRVLKELTVEAAPESFATSRVLDWKAGGLKLGALTFEVRQYLNMDDAAPGVVVREVRRGTPVALAGIKPYELILAVGEKKILTPEECLEALGDLKAPVTIRVSRMGKERTVVIQPMAVRPDADSKDSE